jgi:preprotein translocase subunit SecB
MPNENPAPSEVPPPKLFPAQLRFVVPKIVHLETYVPPNSSININGAPINYTTFSSPYNAQTHLIQIGIRVDAGTKQNEGEDPKAVPTDSITPTAPFFLRLELVAEFEIDESVFPMPRLNEWINKNAPYTLFPFIREHIFSLTARAGFSPLILPLVELPTFKIERPDTKA